ncbi:MAG TPA: 30S ribosomal protein S16 [Chlamydiae bacterium]|nr:30S ribosomal protein S16 [Chlamydiota bacterium]
MALVIRLKKTGRTNRQSFRLVVTDKRTPRDGKYLEMIGWYNPLEEEKEKNLFIKSDRVEFWLQKGAQLSEKAKSLVKRSAPEIIKGLNEKKRLKKKESKPKQKAKTKAKK